MDTTRYMDVVWKLIYSQCLTEEIATLAMTQCYGCKVDHPSQRQHSCLMFDDEANLYFYFRDAIKSLNDEQVLEKFHSHIEKVVPSSFIELYGKKYLSKN